MLKHPLVNIPHDKRYMVCSHKKCFSIPHVLYNMHMCSYDHVSSSRIFVFLWTSRSSVTSDLFSRYNIATVVPGIHVHIQSQTQPQYHNRKNIDVTAHTSVLVMFVPLITLNIVHHDSQHWINQYNQYKYMKTIKLNFKNLDYDINRSVL